MTGRFDSFFLCYCEYCQKDTGSAHAANLFSRSAVLSWLAGSENVCTYQLSGTRHTNCFCRTCGSKMPAYSEATRLLTVPAGSLDSPIPIAPNAKIFLNSEADWVKKLSLLPCFDGLPT
ncbi:GFA family protein [Porticoccaceae bacterium LTM1]|nr:GFA family protein [Porticoccaceae bacterium LTM1]